MSRFCIAQRCPATLLQLDSSLVAPTGLLCSWDPRAALFRAAPKNSCSVLMTSGPCGLFLRGCSVLEIRVLFLFSSWFFLCGCASADFVCDPPPPGGSVRGCAPEGFEGGGRGRAHPNQDRAPGVAPGAGEAGGQEQSPALRSGSWAWGAGLGLGPWGSGLWVLGFRV